MSQVRRLLRPWMMAGMLLASLMVLTTLPGTVWADDHQFEVEGTVTLDGAPLSGVTVLLLVDDTLPYVVDVTVNGQYGFPPIGAGTSVVVEPRLAGYVFSPASIEYDGGPILSEQPNWDFAATELDLEKYFEGGVNIVAVPVGVTAVYVRAWGGGGGNDPWPDARAGGGGGGGGSYCETSSRLTQVTS